MEIMIDLKSYFEPGTMAQEHVILALGGRSRWIIASSKLAWATK